MFLITAILAAFIGVQVAAPAPQTSPAWATRDLRAGIIGTDTSHVPAFTKAFRDHPEWRIKVVAAYKGGSPDFPISANRVEGFAKTIHDEYGVEMVDSIEALLSKVDVVLLESVDGRPHLAQVTPVLKARKPVFVDKPLAASLEDARRIAALAKETGTPLFSSSSVRFHPEIPKMRDIKWIGDVKRVQANYTLNVVPFHPDLYYYGIHGIEALYAVMGPGCTRLARKVTPESDVTTCTWKDGRVGVYNALLKPDNKRPVLELTGSGGTANTGGPSNYDGLVAIIAEFFHTGRAPVALAETLEIFEFMTAAQISKERGGAEVRLTDLRK
jgi:predicted dehydrogenase